MKTKKWKRTPLDRVVFWAVVVMVCVAILFVGVRLACADFQYKVIDICILTKYGTSERARLKQLNEMLKKELKGYRILPHKIFGDTCLVVLEKSMWD